MAPNVGAALSLAGVVAAIVAAYVYEAQNIGAAAVNKVESIKLAACPTDFDSQDAAINHLQTIISFETVSDVSLPQHVIKPDNFKAMWAAVEQAFPLVWRELGVEEAGDGGLSRLITWKGSNATKLPVLFISHVDVVPVQPENVQNWDHPPFSGELAEGFVWGRGSLDVKVTVVALLEAATRLLQRGYQPDRTLLFGFGHDEEVGGSLGARLIARLLKGRYGAVEVVVDEGTPILADGVVPFTPHPVALVGVAEKGFVNVNVTVAGGGGHSSMPPPGGATVIEAAAKLVAAMTASPLPSVLQSPMSDFLQALAPEAPLYLRPLMRHCTLPGLSTLWAAGFSHGAKTMRALVRTSSVPTTLHSGVGLNVIPQRAEINVNMRTLPGFSTEDALAYVRAAGSGAAALPGISVSVEALPSSNTASDVTPPHGVYFNLLKRAVQETQHFDGKPVTVVPFLVAGATDSEKYRHLTQRGILRFLPLPFNITAGDTDRVHGTNERVAVPAYLAAICSYTRILELFGDS